MTCPGRTYMQAVKCVFQYLHGTSHYGLKFQANDLNDILPIVYVDSDWGGDRMDRKSISDFAVLLDGGAISWGSKKQTSVSLLTVETEYIATLTAVNVKDGIPEDRGIE